MEQQRRGVVGVTGIGSMPGTDPAEAARIVAGEFDVPHIVELPQRGPGADMVGRTLGLLVGSTGEFGGETTPTGWRLAGGRTGADVGLRMRRASSWLAEDADRLEEALVGFTGQVKLQVVGPWTMAGSVESARGTRLLADPGACSELVAAAAEALLAHLRDMARRLPGATLIAQVDEPLLPVVAAGGVRTPSGRGVLRTPAPAELVAGLAVLAGAARSVGAIPVVHCCARAVPFAVLGRAGFDAVSVDLAAVGPAADDALGAWWDEGGTVVLGAAPALDDPRLRAQDVARAVSGTWSRIGFGVADVGTRTWLSPACGLAGASPTWARSVGGLLRRAAALLESAE